MTKRRSSAEATAKCGTKKLKESPGRKEKGAKNKADSAEKPPRSKTSPKTPATRKSKYFTNIPPVKEEPEVPEDEVNEENKDVATSRTDSTAALMKVEEEDEEESEEDEEWEEVEELQEASFVVPSQPVEIEIEAPEQALQRQRKEKKKAEFETYLRRMVKRFNKDLLVDIHKVHLLCLVANGIFINRLCSEPDLLAIALSLVPSHLCTIPPERADTSFLSSLLKWFVMTFTLNPELPEEQGDALHSVLEKRLGTLSARNHQEMTHIFLIVLRSLQHFCRLVLSLQPIPLKGPPAQEKGKTSGVSSQKRATEPQSSPGDKRPAEGEKGKKGKKKRKEKKAEEGEPESSEPVTVQKTKNNRRRSVASKVCYKEESSGGEELSDGEEFKVEGEQDSEDSEGEVIKCSDRRRRVKNAPSQSRKIRKKRQQQEDGEKDEEDEGDEEDEECRRKTGTGEDEWLEVYLQRLGRWVCLDVSLSSVGQPVLCSRQATQPMSYVLGVDGDGHLKDLSHRYDPTCMTSSRKRRVEQEWWDETLQSFRSPTSERERKEDEELQAKLLDKPLPISIAEYKNHPLYALKRHLLKYEALYPPTAAILGYCRGEPVYSRDCIHTLHSQDTWLKEARTVRLGEVPYKMVKGFSNRSRKARMASQNKDVDDLALYGQWQTEEYQPPVAVDGKVPRNEYGNVYLFQACMLPIGCVHLRLPNLHRVARKLNIECATAVTGFDFHCGFSHPVNDGYVVCEEHKEILEAAWENEQQILEKKEKEKREKRVLANWTLLVKGLLIRERLRQRYAPKGSEQLAGDEGLSSGEEDVGARHTPVTLTTSWPQNRQEADKDGTSSLQTTSKREKRGQTKHLFPFEKA